jgi:hypothetical protein
MVDAPRLLSSQVKTVCWLNLLFAPVLVTTSRGVTAQTPPRSKPVFDAPLLRLRPAASIPLPPKARVLGASEMRGTKVLFWSSNQLWLAGVSIPSVELCASNLQRIGGAFFLAVENRMAVVDLAASAVRHVDDLCDVWFTLPKLDGEILGVAWDSASLFLLRTGLPHQLFLTRVDTLGRIVAERRFLVDSEQSDRIEWTYLTKTRDGVIVGSHAYPGAWTLFPTRKPSATLLVNKGIPPETLHRLGFAGDVRASLYAGPVLRTGRVFLQTLTDLSTRKRFLVLYDSTGRFVRAGSADTNIGLIASSVGDYSVLGIRRAPSAAIIVYTRIQ